MTSLCTAVGALPFLFASGAGAEQREPIGIVVFFGTTVSVVLTLFVVPAAYVLIARSTRSPEYVSQLVERLRRHPPANAVDAASAAGGTAGAAASGTASAPASATASATAGAAAGGAGSVLARQDQRPV
jgi:hypothetical protein